MRRHLNTLYVTTEEAWLHKDGENVVVKIDGAERGRVPVHLLGGIVCFGSVGASPPLLGHCAEQGVCISFMTRNGRFLARVEGSVSGNVLLRRSQYHATDDPAMTAALSCNLVTGKLLNQRTVVRRALRDHGEDTSVEVRDRLESCEHRLTDAARRVSQSLSTNVIRGIEGEAARVYYGVFGDLIRNDAPAFTFTRPITAATTRPSECACCHSSIRFWFTIAARRWRLWGWIQRWDSCTGSVRDAQAWHSISWRSYVPF